MLDAKLGSGPLTRLAMSPDGAKGDGRSERRGCSRGARHAPGTRPAGTRRVAARRWSNRRVDGGRASAAPRPPPTGPRPTRGHRRHAHTTNPSRRPPRTQELPGGGTLHRIQARNHAHVRGEPACEHEGREVRAFLGRHLVVAVTGQPRRSECAREETTPADRRALRRPGSVRCVSSTARPRPNLRDRGPAPSGALRCRPWKTTEKVDMTTHITHISGHHHALFVHRAAGVWRMAPPNGLGRASAAPRARGSPRSRCRSRSRRRR